MRHFLFTTALLVLGIFISTPAFAGGDALIGTLLGAGVGGYVGSLFGKGGGNVAATTGGVLLGGLIGNDIGNSMDEGRMRSYGSSGFASTAYAAPAYYQPAYVPNYVAPPAPPPPQPVTYIDADYGSYCREYSQQVRIGDRVEESYGTACLQPDGSWRVVQ